MLASTQAALAAGQQPSKPANPDFVRPQHFDKASDPHSLELSPDAMQLADALQLSDRFLKLKQLQKRAQSEASQGSVSLELRQDISETRIEIIELIEQTRLDIDFAAAEIEEEQASVEEVLKFYINERDERVFRSNLWSFRTNGVLWAACEGFSIPTYKYPKLSIPSGTLGIIAGLLPSVFSLVALRSAGGKHYEREPQPNMLSKVYNLPTTPRIEYPPSVWAHLNSPAAGDTRTRRETLMKHWVNNQNIRTLRTGVSDGKIKRLAGVDQRDITIDLLTDRASMLRDLKSCVMQMTRPLMELSMCLRDKKQLSGRLEQSQ